MTGTHAAGRGAPSSTSIVPPRPVRRLHASVWWIWISSGFTARPQDHGVDRLVTVRFGVSDIIIEFIRRSDSAYALSPTAANGPADVQRQAARRARQRVRKTPDAFLHFAPDAIVAICFWSSVGFRLHAFVFISARRCPTNSSM